MKRLGILAFYDQQGIADGYLDYYIQSLVQVVTELVIVVNGIISDSGLEMFRKYTKRIYIRKNEGFDAGAYQYFFNHCISRDELEAYEEVVFSNDTCFGPFVPFDTIFSKMSKSQADFWGINYMDREQMPHLQSNFLVFKKRVMNDVVWYLVNKIPSNMHDLVEVVEKFEAGLFGYLTGLGYSFDSYAKKGRVNVYLSPDYAIIENGYPLLKKKAFDQSKFTGNRDNCIRALKYIHISGTYDIQLILDCAERMYQTAFDLQKEFKRELVTERHVVQNKIFYDEKCLSFINSVECVYIYGAGAWARAIFRRYQNVLKKMKGFIVSDGHYEPGSLYGYEVVKLSQIKDLSTGIIVGLGKKNTEDVKRDLEKYKHVFFLWQ